MKKYMHATAPHPLASLPTQLPSKMPWMTATIAIARVMKIDPAIRVGFLPILSRNNTVGMVAMTLMMPTTPVARSLIVFPSRPSDWKIFGA